MSAPSSPTPASLAPRPALQRWLAVVSVVGLALGTGLGLGGADCGGGNLDDCFPCQSAIVLTVVDEDQQAVNEGWLVEATLDGQPVDTSPCNPDFRVVLNSCSFGSSPGVYRITVTAPGFQTRQIAARFAAQSGDDCRTCLPSANVTAVLER